MDEVVSPLGDQLKVLFETDGVSFEIAKEALRLASQKLPLKTKFVVRNDYEI